MLNIENVSITFKKGTLDEKKALQNVSLTLEDGDFVTVIGGNGAGKSTLLNIIAGTLKPDEGSVSIDGKDITNISDYKRASLLGRVFQDPRQGTAADMQIDENLALAKRRGKMHGLAWGITKAERLKYSDMLKEFDLGLENRLTANVGTLSGGQRQAVTLLMATMNSPKVLLLDEHTAALDPKTAAKVLSLTDKIVKEGNLTTLMITHNMNDAIRYGNRLIMMSDGKIIFDIRGEEKSKLTVGDLLKKFEESGAEATDKMILSD